MANTYSGFSNGPAGYAAKTSGVVSLPSGSSSRTIEFWIKAVYAGSPLCPCAFGSVPASWSVYVIDANTVGIGTNEAKNHYWTAPGIADGTWHHLAVTYFSGGDMADDAICKAYLDGDPIPLTTFASLAGVPATGTGIVSMGGDVDSATVLSGRIDEFRIWNTVRTPTEITTNYLNELNGNEAGLVGYWKANNDAWIDSQTTSAINNLVAGADMSFSPDVPFGGGALPIPTNRFANVQLVFSDINGDVQMMNVGYNDNTQDIFYEVETQEIEFGNRAHFKKISDKVGVLGKFDVGAMLQVTQSDGSVKQIPMELNRRVNIGKNVDIEGNFFTFKWFGTSKKTSPIFEGIYIPDVTGFGMTKK